MLRFNLTRWAAGLFIIIVLSACAAGGQATAQPSPTPTPNTMPAEETPQGYPTPEAQPTQPAQPYPPEASPDLQATAPAAYPPADDPGDGNPYAPRAEDAGLERANAFVDSKQIVMQESFPPRFILSLAGTLPTPCNQLRVEVPTADAEGRIDVSVYSVIDPNQICAQVIEGFEARVPLENLSSGKYTVLVNGEVVDEIEMP